MERILCIGCSHRTASLELRERLSLTARAADELLNELVDGENVHEAVVVSTCNRTELYLFEDDEVEAESRALGLLAKAADVRPTELAGSLYSLRGREAISHLGRVVAGLDSMVVGEAEIQGQMRRALDQASVAGHAGIVFNRLFHGALNAAGQAREQTGIADGAMSIPSVAVELAARQFGSVKEASVVLVGAGETAELTAAALARRGAKLALVANRHRDRAENLAHRFGGQAIGFEELGNRLRDADILVSSTGSPHHVLGVEAMQRALAGREGRPLLAIDLAVPRDIDPDCRDLEGVVLYDLDDLQVMVQRRRVLRESQSKAAEAVIDAELDRFERWLEVQEATPTVAALRMRADEIAVAVMAENEGRWENLGEADRARMESMVRSLVSRLLHEPTIQLKRSVGEGDAYLKVAVLRELFGLDSPSDHPGATASVYRLDDRRGAGGA